MTISSFTGVGSLRPKSFADTDGDFVVDDNERVLATGLGKGIFFDDVCLAELPRDGLMGMIIEESIE